MKVLLSWLREFAPLVGTADEISSQLTDLGMELEGVTTIGEGLDGVVVAKVIDIRAHPDADRIRLVDVDCGDGESLQICCGASNMTPGDLVPLATIGTTMPDGMTIAKRKMRGQVSNGMLCSARELELGDDHSGILILPENLDLGTPLAQALELSQDVVYEFDALPNRPDTLSVAGVARDLAAHQGVAFELSRPEPAAVDSSGLSISVRIDAPELCGRFTALVVAGVKVGPSPRWMAQRLVAAGMRPINNVVDVSNYVMLELGQPTHTYDLAKLPDGELAVRWARDGEQLETLDGVKRSLGPADGVIVDASDEPVGLAGVMGGASTEISESTKDVLVEAAWWNPDVIGESAARHNLHSEASLRFKRGVDHRQGYPAALRVAELLGRTAGGSIQEDPIVVEGNVPEPVTVKVRPNRVNSLLGTEIATESMMEILDPIGFCCTRDGDDLLVDVPSWRPDSSLEVDVAEEVARHYGMWRIPKTLPISPHIGELTPRQSDKRTLRSVLIGGGVSEAMPMPFLAPGDLESFGLPSSGLVLANPLDAQESVLRTSLLPGLVKAVAYNAAHRLFGVRLFEIGRCFDVADAPFVDIETSTIRNTVLAGETERLGVVLAGSDAREAVELTESLLRSVRRWSATGQPGGSPIRAQIPRVSIAESEIAGLHPRRSARVLIDGVQVGSVGEVDPRILEDHGISERVAWIDLDLGCLLEIEAQVPTALAVSRFPTSDVDLAFVVSEDVVAADLRATLVAAALDAAPDGAGPVSVDLFDVFRSDLIGVGTKSLAYRLRFQGDDRTLTDSEVNVMRAAAIEAAESRHAASLRS